MAISRSEAREVAREYRENRGEDEMTASGFMALLTLLIAGGIAFAALVASQTMHLTPQAWWLLPYFGCAFLGIIMGVSQNAVVALIGYVLVILPTGWIVGPYVGQYQLQSVITALWVTVAVTVALGILGAIWHKSVEHWGGYLITALLVLIVIEVASIFMIAAGYKGLRDMFAITDWVAIGIFCAFVFYDMNMAVRMPRNAANAVFAAINMYLNMLNLFVRILARTGKLTVENAGVVAEAAAAIDV